MREYLYHLVQSADKDLMEKVDALSPSDALLKFVELYGGKIKGEFTLYVIDHGEKDEQITREDNPNLSRLERLAELHDIEDEAKIKQSRGDWEPGIDYSKGDFAVCCQQLYRCLRAHCSERDKHPVHSEKYWQDENIEVWPELKTDPDIGNETSDCGEWQHFKHYYEGDVVTFGGKHYICTESHRAINIYKPGKGELCEKRWRLLDPTFRLGDPRDVWGRLRWRVENQPGAGEALMNLLNREMKRAKRRKEKKGFKFTETGRS